MLKSATLSDNFFSERETTQVLSGAECRAAPMRFVYWRVEGHRCREHAQG